ncbi:hyalin-like isoform X2 [Strongylocentrotus purpuratus]|nr:hyalin-like isoform X2 [Strongylocentrotus purpuratus]
MVEGGPGIAVSANWQLATSTHGNVFPILYTPADGSSFSLGNHTVTAYLTGYPHYNCNFTVTVVAPCETNTAYINLAVESNITVDYQYTSAYAPGSSISAFVAADPPTNSSFSIGVTTVNVTYGGLSNYSCIFNVSVIAIVSPDCPENVMVEGGPGIAVPASWQPATSTHGVEFPILYTRASGSSFSLGDHTVTVYLTGYPNISCNFRVTVVAPCKTNTAYIDLTVESSITVDYQYTSAYGPRSLLYTYVEADPLPNTLFNVGVTPVNVMYGAQINYSCILNVNVIAIVSPDCPENVMVEVGPGIRTASVSANWQLATSTHGNVFPILYTPADGSSFSLGNHTVTAYLTGYPHYNCNFTVTVVEDLSPPVFSTDLDVLTFHNSQAPSWVLTASDNLGVVTLTSSPSPGSYFPLGETEVTVTATDNAMFTSTEIFTVRVVSDGSPQTTNCPEDQLHKVAPSEVPRAVTWSVPSATGSGTITTTSNYSPNDMFREGTTKVTYKFTDDAGRSSKCFFYIKITINADVITPDVTCPGDVTVTKPAGTVLASVTWNEPVFNNLVSRADLVYIQQSKQSGSSFTEGSTEVLYSALDGKFNRALYCMFTVTVNLVEDNDKPVIVGCPQNFTHWVTAGQTTAPVSWVAPDITDNSSFTVQVSHEPGSEFTVGMDTVVSYVATDVVNNMEDCTFTISVRADADDPMLQCPSNVNIRVTLDMTDQVVTWPTPNATDNSGGVTVNSNPESGAAFQASVAGQNDTVTVTAADAYGNSDTCTFLVNVRYDVQPVLTCPDVSQETAPGQRDATVTWPDVVITDDYTSVSALVITKSHGSMIANMQYDADLVTVTLTAQDELGNIGRCTFTVDVVDTEKPVWSACPMNVTEMAEIGTNSKVVSWDDLLLVITQARIPSRLTTLQPLSSSQGVLGLWSIRLLMTPVILEHASSTSL